MLADSIPSLQQVGSTSLHPASVLQRHTGSKVSATVQKISHKVGSWGLVKFSRVEEGTG